MSLTRVPQGQQIGSVEGGDEGVGVDDGQRCQSCNNTRTGEESLTGFS